MWECKWADITNEELFLCFNNDINHPYDTSLFLLWKLLNSPIVLSSKTLFTWQLLKLIDPGSFKLIDIIHTYVKSTNRKPHYFETTLKWGRDYLYKHATTVKHQDWNVHFNLCALPAQASKFCSNYKIAAKWTKPSWILWCCLT